MKSRKAESFVKKRKDHLSASRPLSHEKNDRTTAPAVDYLSRSGPVSLPVLRQKFENASTLVENLSEEGPVIVAEQRVYAALAMTRKIGVRNGLLFSMTVRKRAP